MNVAVLESDDFVKTLNERISYAKAVQIRNQQMDELKDKRKLEKKLEKQMCIQMEIDRLKKYQELERREKERFDKVIEVNSVIIVQGEEDVNSTNER